VESADDTPGRLVAAATQLIADGGQEATSLRAVSRAARSNAAAVHYHFGGRDELLTAVVAQLLRPVQRRRLELLEQVGRRHGPLAPAVAVVDALVRPDLELLAQLHPDRVRVANLLGQPAVPGSAVAALLERQFDALAAAALPLLDPVVPVEELRERLRWVRAVASSVLAGAAEQDTVDDRLEWLVGFAAAGLSAPPAPRPSRPPKAARSAGGGPASKAARSGDAAGAGKQPKPKKRKKTA
jgi:AcrR family transcriptional regulator